MNRIRAALPWKKKNYHGDSDSTGYCSSSELSKTLSDSQFILRPNTALMSSSYSNCTNYYALDYSEFSAQRPSNRDPKATITSRTSTISSTTFKSHSQSLSASMNSADDEAEKNSDDDDTVRANSVCRVTSRASLPMMMPKLTSIKHLMKEALDTGSDEEDDDDDELETIDEVTTTYDFEDGDQEEDEDDDTIDIPAFKKHQPLKRWEFKNSSFRSFPFSYKIVENEMDRLFDMLQVDEQIPSTSSNSNPSESTIRRKRLLIKEPITKIYYHEQSTSEAPPPIPLKPSIQRTESTPRSILKNASSFAIYEEIYGDHLTPQPTDIRPRLPDRPIMAFQQFPPCTTFQPKHPQRLPSIRRRKKLPSLHHSTSFASYFRRKK